MRRWRRKTQQRNSSDLVKSYKSHEYPRAQWVWDFLHFCFPLLVFLPIIIKCERYYYTHIRVKPPLKPLRTHKFPLAFAEIKSETPVLKKLTGILNKNLEKLREEHSLWNEKIIKSITASHPRIRNFFQAILPTIVNATGYWKDYFSDVCFDAISEHEVSIRLHLLTFYFSSLSLRSRAKRQ
jgi:hypothetical protein